MIRLIAIGAAAGALLAAGCGGDDKDDSSETGAVAPTSSTASETDAVAPARKGTTVRVSNSDYGKILFDGDDQAIYLFDKEKGSKSECYDDCATAWPPVLTKGEPQAGAGADATQLGSTKRSDGGTQVTYAGHPLYHYEDDPPGEVLCQNVSEFGGLWLVVDAGGEAVRGG